MHIPAAEITYSGMSNPDATGHPTATSIGTTRCQVLSGGKACSLGITAGSRTSMPACVLAN